MRSTRLFALLVVAAMGAATLPNAMAQAALPTASTPPSKTPSRVVFQVTDGDVGRWNMVLNNVKNLQAALVDEGSEIEVVTYGPGINMLKADSAVATRIAEVRGSGVRVVACENTMKNMKLVPADMLADIGYVPAGVVEVMRKQQAGWAYIRP